MATFEAQLGNLSPMPPPKVRRLGSTTFVIFCHVQVLTLSGPAVITLNELSLLTGFGESTVSKHLAICRAHGLIVSRPLYRGGPSLYDAVDRHGNLRYPEKFAKMGGALPACKTPSTPVEGGGRPLHCVESRALNLDWESENVNVAKIAHQTPFDPQDCLDSQAESVQAKLDAEHSRAWAKELTAPTPGLLQLEAPVPAAAPVASSAVPTATSGQDATPDGFAEDPSIAGMTELELRAFIAQKAVEFQQCRRKGTEGLTIVASKQAAMRRLAKLRGEPDPFPESVEPSRPVRNPSRPAAIVPASQGRLNFDTVLHRVNRDASPEQIEDLVQRLMEDLNDYKPVSERFFRKTARRVQAGELRPRIVFQGYTEARKQWADNPGSVFSAYIRDHGLKPKGGPL